MTSYYSTIAEVQNNHYIAIDENIWELQDTSEIEGLLFQENNLVTNDGSKNNEKMVFTLLYCVVNEVSINSIVTIRCNNYKEINRRGFRKSLRKAQITEQLHTMMWQQQLEGDLCPYSYV